MRIAILADSSSGLIEQPQKNLFIMPLPVILPEGTEFFDDLKNQATQTSIINQIKTQNLTTSNLNPGILEFKINQILEKFDFIFYLPIAYNLSGQYHTALNLVQQHAQLAAKVKVVKHYFTGIQLGNFILMLLTKIHHLEQKRLLKINDLVLEWEQKSCLIVIPGSLTTLARGGRVNSLIAKVLEHHDRKVAILWSHHPKRLTISKNYEKIVEKFIKKVADSKQLSATTKFFLAVTSLCDDQIVKVIIKQFWQYQIKIIKTHLPLVFAVHGGVNTVGLCAIND